MGKIKHKSQKKEKIPAKWPCVQSKCCAGENKLALHESSKATFEG